jgi:uncharacterized SAM-binding protein YcdF (DUF218 family)
MFYIFSKLFTFLIMPLGILLILIFSMIISKNRTNSRKLGILTLLLTYLFSCPAINYMLASCWEIPTKNIRTIRSHDVGILLTGGLLQEDSKFPNNYHLGSSADRIWQTLHLYKMKKITSVIITGGDISIFNKKKAKEIDYAYQFLLLNGIPKDKITLESKARNTHENAKNSAELIQKNFFNKSLLLITSSYHSKRALACFRKEGLVPSIFPSNPMINYMPLEIIDFIPSAYAFKNTELLLKEMMGYVIYKTMGYL